MKTSNNPDTETLQPDAAAPEKPNNTPGTATDSAAEIANEQTDKSGRVDSALSAEENIVRLQTEVEQLRDTLLRRTAEFDNIKKRMLRERLQLLDDARFEALKSFLPVNDDLQRTLEAARDTEIPASFLEGVVMVAEKFVSILTSNGVEAIDKTGVPFDVNLHDALMRQPAPDGKTPSDTVLQILETGYKAGDKIIRHAKVIVSE
jgi:molecular chaperone GrpE